MEVKWIAAVKQNRLNKSDYLATCTMTCTDHCNMYNLWKEIIILNRGYSQQNNYMYKFMLLVG